MTREQQAAEREREAAMRTARRGEMRRLISEGVDPLNAALSIASSGKGATMKRFLILEPNGDYRVIPFRDLLLANEEDQEVQTFAVTAHVGQSQRFGGGASETRTIARISDAAYETWNKLDPQPLDANCAHCLGDLDINKYGDLVCRNPQCFFYTPTDEGYGWTHQPPQQFVAGDEYFTDLEDQKCVWFLTQNGQNLGWWLYEMKDGSAGYPIGRDEKTFATLKEAQAALIVDRELEDNVTPYADLVNPRSVSYVGDEEAARLKALIQPKPLDAEGAISKETCPSAPVDVWTNPKATMDLTAYEKALAEPCFLDEPAD